MYCTSRKAGLAAVQAACLRHHGAAAGLAGELQVLAQRPKLLESTTEHRKAGQSIDQSDTA